MSYRQLNPAVGEVSCDAPGCQELLSVGLDTGLRVADANLAQWLIISHMGIVPFSTYDPGMPKFNPERVVGTYCRRCARVLIDALLEKNLMKPPVEAQIAEGVPQ